MLHAGLLTLFIPKTSADVTLVEFQEISFRPHDISKVVLNLSKDKNAF